MKHLIIALTAIFALASCSSQSEEDKGVIKYAKEAGFTINGDDVKKSDPAILFCYANHLFEEGKQDEAVFWYYVAQYRYRFMSSCSEHLKAGSLTEAQGRKILVKTGVYTEDRIGSLHLIGGIYRIELYETIQTVLGRKINGYAFGDMEQLKATIDRMLKYQEENPFNPMGMTPQPLLKSEEVQAEKLTKIKESYAEQKEKMDEKADYIRETRLENGLENRN